MTTGRSAARACDEMRLLIQADLDGELDAAAAAVLGAHIADCAGCRAEQRDLTRLSAALREVIPRHHAPKSLRRRIEGEAAPAMARRWRRLRPLLSFGAGAALAATLALALLPSPPGDGLEAQLLASHIRALQPGHLTDVLSSDRHTVKPWFDGRIDFSPPVHDFAAQGFPLLGGRLDYVGGRAVAVLVYGQGRHVVDLYVWPDAGAAPGVPALRPLASDHGYNVASWSDGGMRLCAVSDTEPAALARLAALWRAADGLVQPGVGHS